MHSKSWKSSKMQISETNRWLFGRHSMACIFFEWVAEAFDEGFKIRLIHSDFQTDWRIYFNRKKFMHLKTSFLFQSASCTFVTLFRCFVVALKKKTYIKFYMFFDCKKTIYFRFVFKGNNDTQTTHIQKTLTQSRRWMHSLMWDNSRQKQKKNNKLRLEQKGTRERKNQQNKSYARE